jgi:hypothetical protein
LLLAFTVSNYSTVFESYYLFFACSISSAPLFVVLPTRGPAPGAAAAAAAAESIGQHQQEQC